MMLSEGLRASVVPSAPTIAAQAQFVPTIDRNKQENFKSDSLSNFSVQEIVIHEAIHNFSGNLEDKVGRDFVPQPKIMKHNARRNVKNKNDLKFVPETPVANLMFNRSGRQWLDDSFPTLSYKTTSPSSTSTMPASIAQYLTSKTIIPQSLEDSNHTTYSSPFNHSGLLSSSSTLQSVTDHPAASGAQPTVEKFPVYIRIWASIALAIVLVIGVIGNALVPVLVCLNKDLRHSTNLYLLNLAAADLLVLLVCLPTALVELHGRPETWVLGPVMCWLVPLVEVLVTRASVLTLVVISVERYLAICRPLRTSTLCSKPRAAFVCGTLWVLALVSAIPTLKATQYLEAEYHDGSEVQVCLTGLHHTWVSNYYLASAAVFVLLPFLLLLAVYTLIACRLLLQRPHAPPRYLAMQQWRAKKQVALMLGAVVVVFFLCLLPFQVLTVWIIISTEQAVRDISVQTYYNVLYMCRLLLYINSAANPVIYNVMSSKFRQALLRLLGLRPPETGDKRPLTRQSTMTTSFSSSSFVSLRRRASQVFSRTVTRKTEPVGGEQQPKAEDKYDRTSSNPATSSIPATSSNPATSSTSTSHLQPSAAHQVIFRANLSEDDLHNQNYNSIDIEKCIGSLDRQDDREGHSNDREVGSEVFNVSKQNENHTDLDERTLAAGHDLNVEFCERCNVYFHPLQPDSSLCLQCDSFYSSTRGRLHSEMAPLNTNCDSHVGKLYPIHCEGELSLPKSHVPLEISPTPSEPISIESETSSSVYHSRLDRDIQHEVCVPADGAERGVGAVAGLRVLGRSPCTTPDGSPAASSFGGTRRVGRSPRAGESPVVVHILDNESASPMLPRYTKPIRPPRGRKTARDRKLKSRVPDGLPTTAAKKTMVKKVSFKDTSENSEELTSL